MVKKYTLKITTEVFEPREHNGIKVSGLILLDTDKYIVNATDKELAQMVATSAIFEAFSEMGKFAKIRSVEVITVEDVKDV